MIVLCHGIDSISRYRTCFSVNVLAYSSAGRGNADSAQVEPARVEANFLQGPR